MTLEALGTHNSVDALQEGREQDPMCSFGWPGIRWFKILEPGQTVLFKLSRDTCPIALVWLMVKVSKLMIIYQKVCFFCYFVQINWTNGFILCLPIVNIDMLLETFAIISYRIMYCNIYYVRDF